MNPTDNIDNNTLFELTNVGDAFTKQSDLLDDTINNLYNDELYQDDFLNDGLYYHYFFDKDSNNVLKNFEDLFENNTKRQKTTIDTVKVSSDNISNSYNYSVDMYRNQNVMNKFMQNKVDRFREKNKALLDELDTNIRLKEKYTYYYKKKQYQIKMLYSIILACGVGFVLTFFNKNFKMIMPNSLFLFLLAFLFVMLIGYNSIQIFEIMFRTPNNFDEYNFDFVVPKKGSLSKELNKDIDVNKDEKECSSQIQNYKSVVKKS